MTLFDPTTGELIDEAILDTLPINRKKAILSLLTPNLLYFHVDKNITIENQDVVISWNLQYAKDVKIIYNRSSQELATLGNLTLSFNNDTEIKLVYESYSGSKFESETISIKVYPIPEIFFDATKLKIEKYSSTIITWKIKKSVTVRFSNEIETSEISQVGEYITRPLQDTTYKISVTALDNITVFEKEIVIQVFEKPEIIFFNVEPEVVLDCEPVTFSWNVQNAKRIEINNGIGEVMAEGNKKLLLDKSRSFFTLKAEGELSSCTAEVIVRIFPTPIIESLIVPMPDFESRINLNPIIITSPKIDVAINMPDFNFNPPLFNNPDVNLNKIKPTYKSKVSIFNFLKIYEHIRRKYSIK